MTSKIFQRIASVYLVIILIILSAINQPVYSNKIVDLIESIRNRSTDDNRPKNNLGTDVFFFLLNLFLKIRFLVSEFRDIIQTIQNVLYNTSIPG
jgi:hypothetical protein